MLPSEAVQQRVSLPVEAPANDPLAPDIETASDRYALRFSGEVGGYFLEVQAQAVATLLELTGSDPLTILEVGGGHAQLAPVFLARGHSVVVHGSSTACFERLAPVEQQHPDRVQRLLGALHSIPAADAAFDVVCSIRLLAHVTSWRRLLAEKCRLSRRFVICEFTTPQGAQRLSRPLHSLKVQLEPDTRPFTTVPLADVSAEFERHGFRVIEVQRQYMLPMAMHRRLRSAAFSRWAEGLFASVGMTQRMGSPIIVLAERMTQDVRSGQH
jgi:ubiquinone/menaquinone biosynthesis C-methylase UbiE